MEQLCRSWADSPSYDRISHLHSSRSRSDSPKALRPSSRELRYRRIALSSPRRLYLLEAASSRLRPPPCTLARVSVWCPVPAHHCSFCCPCSSSVALKYRVSFQLLCSDGHASWRASGRRRACHRASSSIPQGSRVLPCDMRQLAERGRFQMRFERLTRGSPQSPMCSLPSLGSPSISRSSAFGPTNSQCQYM